MKVLNRILRQCLRKPDRRTAGFTLTELIVTMVITLIIINAILGFMVSLLNSERQEQAKVTTQQSMQSALDFIANDVKSAVYIYDADGLEAIRSKLPPASGVTNLPQCDNTNECEPILVFWKRQFLDKCSYVGAVRVGRVTGGPTATNADCDPEDQTTWTGNDALVYSLVGYYLIRDNPVPTNSIWSNAARIGRFEIRDGVPNAYPGKDDETGYETAPYILPDPGFQAFVLTPGETKTTAMNDWKATLNEKAYPDVSKAYPASSLQILTDYVDDTVFSNPQLPYPISSSATQANADCSSPTKGAGGQNADGTAQSQRIPKDFNTLSLNPKLSSFYVCVNSQQNIARVYIRGNALARLNQRNRVAPNIFQQQYVVQIDAQIAGRGGLQN